MGEKPTLNLGKERRSNSEELASKREVVPVSWENIILITAAYPYSTQAYRIHTGKTVITILAPRYQSIIPDAITDQPLDTDTPQKSWDGDFCDFELQHQYFAFAHPEYTIYTRYTERILFASAQFGAPNKNEIN